MPNFHETKRRSFAKAITLRIIIVFADIIIVYGLTHRYDITLSVIFITNFLGTIIHFIHERIWNKITWEKKKHNTH